MLLVAVSLILRIVDFSPSNASQIRRANAVRQARAADQLHRGLSGPMFLTPFVRDSHHLESCCAFSRISRNT
jgi:hypothetical protein